MSRYPGAFGLARWAVRRPRATLRIAQTRTLWAALLVLAGLPPRLRSLAVAPFDAVARQALRRAGDHAIAAPVHVLAVHGRGERADALHIAVDLGAGGSRRTVSALARLALALEAPGTADTLVSERDADPGDPAWTALRGEVALAMGRYRLAAHDLGAALAREPGSMGLRWKLDHAEAELALLDPDWRPTPAITAPGRAAGQSSTPGRVMHLLTNSLPHTQAGYTVRAQQVALSQRAAGLDPIMVTRAGYPGTVGIIAARSADIVDGVTYRRIEPALAPGLRIDALADRTAAGLVELVQRWHPSVLQPTTNYVNAQVALAVGDAHGIPVVYEVRGFLEETWLARMGPAVLDGERYGGARAIETALMRRAAAVVTLSETMRTDILGRGGIAPERVVVVPNAVDVDRFTPGPRDPALAASLGIQAAESVVGYISSLTAYEGIPTVIEAVAILRAAGRRVRLLIVGDGDERARLEVAARDAGLLDSRAAIFTGRVPHDQVERYYRTIDVFVVPRTDDRVSRLVTPLKPYEAMAMAKPMIVSAVPALLEIVEEGRTGRSFRAGDAHDLASVIDGILDDPEAAQALGEAARTWVLANRTWAHNGARYLELYRRLGVA